MSDQDGEDKLFADLFPSEKEKRDAPTGAYAEDAVLPTSTLEYKPSSYSSKGSPMSGAPMVSDICAAISATKDEV